MALTTPASAEPESAPHRPRSLSKAQLGYTMRPRVPWLRPQLLANTAVRAGLAEMFGAYLDKRELQGALPAETYRHDTDGDLWIDYVADLGDGFNATYSVAWLLAQEQLEVTDPDGAQHTLPRSQVLIMGGDQVYPTADWRTYEDRCKGPYRSALPDLGNHPPTLYALPGNHDWYDGLTAFLRLFGKREPMGGWMTRQTRSYFAVELPRRWWLFAIDAQFDAYLDEPQLEYFYAAAEKLEPGDRVMICAARPTWVYGGQAPHEYDTIDYFIRRVVAPTGATVSLLIAGDAHHYARYAASPEPRPAAGDQPATSTPENPGRQLITCGGGGAYLAATHMLPESLNVPPEGTLVRESSPRRRYDLKASYPDPAQSRRYSWGVFWRLPMRNPGFGTLLAALHTLLLAAYVSASAEGAPWFTVPALGMSTVWLLAGVGFATVDRKGPVRPRHVVAGLIHGLIHLAVGVLGLWLWTTTGIADLPAVARLAVAIVAYAPLAGVVATQLVCAYLAIAHRFGVNVNELYAGQGIENSKVFLRFKIGRDGSMTAYPVAVDTVCHRWRAVPDDPAGSAWIAPVDPLRPRLAEPPVAI